MSTLDNVTDIFFSSFDKAEHEILDGQNIIPDIESGLLFNVAGMSALLPYFLRQKQATFQNALSAQRCIRLNDLDCIGDDTHLSGFIMLGLFSFGSYSKEQAIKSIWNFLSKCIDNKRLTVTVHRDDKEALSIWTNILDDTNKIFAGYEDNFWSYAINGPCGKCTEIFYNHENGQSIEIANIVFMEYIRNDGQITKCEKMFIDVGVGMERLEVIRNSQDNIFSMKDMIATNNIINSSITAIHEQRILCDHIRTLSWMISNNILPGSKRRESVCKKLMRRVYAIFDNNQVINAAQIICKCFEARGIDANNLVFIADDYVKYQSANKIIEE